MQPEPGHRYRSVWISDVHLGTPGCQAQVLFAFLKEVECEHLFLGGDIMDGWQLRRGWYWPQAHNDVLQELLCKASIGTRVVFIPGSARNRRRRAAACAVGVSARPRALAGTGRHDRLAVTLEPGETLFVPLGKWHQVRSLDISISLSFTNVALPNDFRYRDR